MENIEVILLKLSPAIAILVLLLVIHFDTRRKTCARWTACYGNNMPFAKRNRRIKNVKN